MWRPAKWNIWVSYSQHLAARSMGNTLHQGADESNVFFFLLIFRVFTTPGVGYFVLQQRLVRYSILIWKFVYFPNEFSVQCVWQFQFDINFNQITDSRVRCAEYIMYLLYS